jgi:Cysteine-rich CPXCG
MENTAEYICAYCGESSLTFVDISAGYHQSYIEDCQVCCQPNVLFVRIGKLPTTKLGTAMVGAL